MILRARRIKGWTEDVTANKNFSSLRGSALEWANAHSYIFDEGPLIRICTDFIAAMRGDHWTERVNREFHSFRQRPDESVHDAATRFRSTAVAYLESQGLSGHKTVDSFATKFVWGLHDWIHQAMQAQDFATLASATHIASKVEFNRHNGRFTPPM